MAGDMWCPDCWEKFPLHFRVCPECQADLVHRRPGPAPHLMRNWCGCLSPRTEGSSGLRDRCWKAKRSNPSNAASDFKVSLVGAGSGQAITTLWGRRSSGFAKMTLNTPERVWRG